MHYYNEFDEKAAAWLRALIADGQIPHGEVDTRSIEDVKPNELTGYTQCHFFAGIGGWPLALKLAGVPESTRLWTGSCPCQPFSAAGAGAGFADERHLWPAWEWLIGQCRPATILGEQVASAAVGPWIDLVSTDLEAMGYAFGAYAGPAAGVGAPHIRDRTYWVAHAGGARPQEQQRRRIEPARSSADGAALRLADAHRGQCNRVADGEGGQRDGSQAGRFESDSLTSASGELLRLANTDGGHTGPEWEQRGGKQRQQPQAGSGCLRLADASGERRIGRKGLSSGCVDDRSHAGREQGHNGSVGHNEVGDARACSAGPVNGHWRAADWLGCRDGKWRPVEPGTFPLAHGLPARVGRLRGYGNAIVPQQAAAFIRAVMP